MLFKFDLCHNKMPLNRMRNEFTLKTIVLDSSTSKQNKSTVLGYKHLFNIGHVTLGLLKFCFLTEVFYLGKCKTDI